MKITKTGLIVNKERDRNFLITKKLVNYLIGKGVEVFIPEDIILKFPESKLIHTLTESYQGLNMFFSLGGDGTLLRAARLASPHGIPVCGINLGGLGFLTQVGIEEIDHYLPQILANDCRIEERMMLSGYIHRNGKRQEILLS